MSVNRYDQDEINTTFKFNVFKRSFKYLKNYKFKLLTILMLSCFGSIISLFPIRIIQYIVDRVVPDNDINLLIILSLFILLIIIINIVLNLIKSRSLNRVKQSVAADLKSDIFIHLQYLPSNFYETRPHGKILVRATSYAETVAQCLCNSFLETILELINIVFVLIFMFTCHVPLTIYTIVFAVIVLLFFIKITPIRRKKQHVVNNKVANCNAYLAESINGINVTHAYNREEKNEEIFSSLEDERIESLIKILPFYNLGWSITAISAEVVNISIYIIGLFFFYPSTSLGTIIAIGGYASNFWNPIRNITSVYSEIMDAVTYLERIFELLDEPLVIENMESPKEINITGKIEFKDVSFGYVEGNKVLDNINFVVKPNQRVAFVGETGSGKSTIINLLARYYDADSGKILIDDIPIKDLELSSLRKQINVMLQDNYVFSRTILENIMYGKSTASMEEVIKVCKELCIHDWITSLKNGYDTLLHNNGTEISTGQRQLICFARAILANPQILVLDEATSNVDLKTEKLVQDGIKKLLKNRTSVVIAHRLATITDCDIIMLVKNKHIYEMGTHSELMNLKGEYYKLYNSQL